jgi:hypothetical protein
MNEGAQGKTTPVCRAKATVTNSPTCVLFTISSSSSSMHSYQLTNMK